MEFSVCPLCGSSAIQKKRGHYKFNIKGKSIAAPLVQYWECPNCGEAFFDKQANKRIDEALLLNHKRPSAIRTRKHFVSKAQAKAYARISDKLKPEAPSGQH
jgi:YgiT-type zinc finger domain-containing protein